MAKRKNVTIIQGKKNSNISLHVKGVISGNGSKPADPKVAPKKFFKACEDAGIEPTKRQFSKFRNNKGAAFNRAWEKNSVLFKKHNFVTGEFT